MTQTLQAEVFHRWRCPFCRRLRAYLTEKDLAVTLRKFHPDSDIEELRALNPKAQVPTWREEGLALFESFVIMQYVEEQHPGPSLAPESARDWARTRLLYDLSDNAFTPSMIGFVRVAADHPSRPQHRDDIAKHAADIARLLHARGPFAFGQRFTLADLSLPPLLYRCLEAGLEPEVLPQRIRTWAAAVLARPSVAELYPDIRI